MSTKNDERRRSAATDSSAILDEVIIEGQKRCRICFDDGVLILKDNKPPKSLTLKLDDETNEPQTVTVETANGRFEGKYPTNGYVRF